MKPSYVPNVGRTSQVGGRSVAMLPESIQGKVKLTKRRSNVERNENLRDSYWHWPKRDTISSMVVELILIESR